LEKKKGSARSSQAPMVKEKSNMWSSETKRKPHPSLKLRLLKTYVTQVERKNF